MTQLLLKPAATEKTFHKAKAVACFIRLWFCSIGGLQRQHVYYLSCGQMRARVCAIINERLRPVLSDVGTEVVALVVKTNMPEWRR